jgi:hypothetical protein
VSNGSEASDNTVQPVAASLAPEHNWPAAARVLQPVLRPPGTAGYDGRDLRVPIGAALPAKPLVAQGPAGLIVAYVIPGPGFSVFAGVEHLLSWAVNPDEMHAAAMANLAAWSASAAWVAEGDGPRRILFSETGQGMDAARILLPEVRAHLVAELGGEARVLIGLPDRDLLVAASVTEGDEEFATLLAVYVAERWGQADDPISEHLFELVDGELAVFRPPVRSGPRH